MACLQHWLIYSPYAAKTSNLYFAIDVFSLWWRQRTQHKRNIRSSTGFSLCSLREKWWGGNEENWWQHVIATHSWTLWNIVQRDKEKETMTERGAVWEVAAGVGEPHWYVLATLLISHDPSRCVQIIHEVATSRQKRPISHKQD